ncbi:hypothetical protein Patl1_01924 [Pistacia atlantica]|uniref:Uncharacterized protein n=1 Tax=Pistacia atlantica TaxID=434234 RepID=A0ACC1C7L2_9ROSI|nr:hypothetical protein Patl1_01924 [Pistacia atlantica]
MDFPSKQCQGQENRKPAAELLDYYCNQPGHNCSDLMTAFRGRNCCLNSSSAGAFLHHKLQSTSTKNMIHMAQSKVSELLSQ